MFRYARALMPTGRHRRIAAGTALCGLAASLLMGCSPSGGSASPTAANAASTVKPVAGRPQPTTQKHNGTVKIAIIGYSNNPFFVNVKNGADTANKVLKAFGGSVDWINAGTNIDVPTVNTAVQAASTQGYNGIGFFIAGDGNCPIIKALSPKIAMGVYNSEIPCVAPSGGVIDYSQASYSAGKNSAKELLKALNGKGGKVGIITNLFSSPSNEKRRQGFIDGLEGSSVTIVNKGVEAHDSASETATAAQNYLQSTPDLVAIYCTAGGPFGAAQAVKAAGKEKDVKVIGYDITAENIAALKDGSLYGVTGQDAFGQGYNVAIALFNAAVTGKKPTEVNVAAVSPFVTLANFAQHDPSKQPLGAPGTS